MPRRQAGRQARAAGGGGAARCISCAWPRSQWLRASICWQIKRAVAVLAACCRRPASAARRYQAWLRGIVCATTAGAARRFCSNAGDVRAGTPPTLPAEAMQPHVDGAAVPDVPDRSIVEEIEE
ncbi:hypothetical protein NPIL_197611 [Nephila pilipes]|uniref:Uncharacterized protein n=1 Tax=Nephila pilipes TaxID=299642 RepID=A0A8X6UN11_NEPPI|nr:hypothetical protein NPIL_197611 [Nephila pilipes]